MKFRHLTIALALTAILVLAACGGLTPEQQQEQIDLAARIAEIGKMIQAGIATPDQFAELGAALARQNELREASDGSVRWDLVLTGAASVIGSLFGVGVWRGSPNARKGSAPSAAS